VAAVVDGVSVEGFVDLLVATGDELTVVDYKTDAARTDAELDAALVRYEPQGAAYALALEQLLGRPVARCVFVFARGQGPAVECEVTDLRARVADVRARLGAVPRGGTAGARAAPGSAAPR
jgi:RecB family exonuclease